LGDAHGLVDQVARLRGHRRLLDEAHFVFVDAVERAQEPADAVAGKAVDPADAPLIETLEDEITDGLGSWSAPKAG
jgi:hypothetical protein